MRELNSDMDKVFRDKLEGYQQQPPEEIWTGIRQGMKKPARKILIPLWQAAAGMALIITAGSIYFFLSRQPDARLAEGFSLAPNNLQTTTPSNPGTIKTESAVSAFIETPKAVQVSTGRPAEAVNSRSGVDAERNVPAQDLIAQSGTNELRTITANVASAIKMPDACIEEAHSDMIPRYKNNVKPSWDLLTAGQDQVTDNSETLTERILLSAQATPTYSYRDIAGSTNSSFNTYETGKLSASGGLQFGYKTSKRLSISTGVMYSQLGYNIDQVGSYAINKAENNIGVLGSPDELSTVYRSNNSIGTISPVSANAEFIGSNSKDFYSDMPVSTTGNSQTTGTLEQFFQYLEVPLLLRYRIIDQRFGVNLLGGLSTNFLVGNRAVLSTNGNSSELGESKNIRSINYLGNMGLGFDYSLTKNLMLTMEPQFKYFLNSINQSSLVSNRPYTLGMFTGVKVVF
jgi:hypothetical protein